MDHLTDPEARRFLDLLADDFAGVGQRGVMDTISASMPFLGFAFARGQDAYLESDRRVLAQAPQLGSWSPTLLPA